MQFRRAEARDVDAIIEIIQGRIDWMDETGLEQWNKTDYMTCYPRDYFLRNIRYFIVCEDEAGRMLAAMAAYEQDARWPEQIPAYYIHHLATAPQAKGAGRAMIAYAEDLARQNALLAVRLDSAIDNKKLSAYYEALGYPAVGECVDGAYVGLLREKRV